jgi:8-oxo-dGTP pyrophosphatase MutT (NUDIX family)
MICRKDTLGFTDFVRGNYSLTNLAYIKGLVDIMTKEEITKLQTWTFKDLWNYLWGGNIGIQHRGEERTSGYKFRELQQGISHNECTYSLESILLAAVPCWGEPEWGFPKGRRNPQENSIACALREFEEETGVVASSLKIIQNLTPMEEVFTGSNNKSYKHNYYIAEITDDVELSGGFQKTEVSAVRWLSYLDALEHIRPYNIEKKEILIRTNELLTKYRICV